MTNIEKLRSGGDIFVKKHADWGPETERGPLVELEIEVSLRHNDKKEDYCLSICGNLLIKECKKLGLEPIDTGGQCEGVIVQYLADSGLRCRALEKVIPIWKEWHLNDCHAGTVAQDKCLEAYKAANPDWNWDYDNACKVLRQKDLCEDKQYLVGGKPYKYGSAWLFRKIPQNVLEELCGILDSEFVLEKIKKEDQ